MGRREGVCVVVFVHRREGVCVVVFVPSPADPSRDVGRECLCICILLVDLDPLWNVGRVCDFSSVTHSLNY